MTDKEKQEQSINKEAKTISVGEYRKKVAGEIQTVELPSKAVFKIKRLSVMDYLKEGLTDIPNEYFGFVQELQEGKVNFDSEKAKKNYEVFEKFLQITIEKGVISPSVILKYDEKKAKNHLLFSELTQEDQKALVGAISGK